MFMSIIQIMDMSQCPILKKVDKLGLQYVLPSLRFSKNSSAYSIFESLSLSLFYLNL